MLSLSGFARVIWSGRALLDFAGAERLLQVRVESGLLWRRILQSWSPPEWTPQLLQPRDDE